MLEIGDLADAKGRAAPDAGDDLVIDERREANAGGSPSTRPSGTRPAVTEARTASVLPTSSRNATAGWARRNPASTPGSTYAAIVVLAVSTSSPPGSSCAPTDATASSSSPWTERA